MTAPRFTSLRDLVLHYAAQRGWHTQRQIAVFCGLDESALSRLLNGEQDIGARRTHALFQAVGIPVELYDLAYALLGQAQVSAARTLHILGGRPPARRSAGRRGPHGLYRLDLLSRQTAQPAPRQPAPQLDPSDVPAAVVLTHFAARRLSGEQIAAFFDHEPAR